MDELKIGNLTVKIPIIQGGMGIGVSLSGLAAAVANQGGIGVISSVGIGMTEPNYKKNVEESNKIVLRREIHKAREMTNGAIGVNIMMALTDYEALLDICLENKIDVVFIGAGLPLKKPDKLEESGTKFIPKVSSSRAANLIFKHWMEKYNRVPDAVVIEGALCGGHIGFKKKDILENKTKSLASIVKETVREIDFYQQKFGIEIPVIAAGGIYSGKDIYNIMKIGAKAVKMGTRFVTTHECDADIEFKLNYIKAKESDITLIDSPVGMPGRVITNEFVRDIQLGQKKPINCGWRCIKYCNYKSVQFCIAEALLNSVKGDFDKGFSFAGSNAYKATEIVTVKECFEQILKEYNAVTDKVLV
jgi:nitronate monooxygenase